jgi:hypothetical protein
LQGIEVTWFGQKLMRTFNDVGVAVDELDGPFDATQAALGTIATDGNQASTWCCF